MANDVTLKLLENQNYLRVGKISKVIFSTKNPNFLIDIRKNTQGVSLNNELYLFSIDFIQDEDKNNFLVGASVILKQLPQSNSMNIKFGENDYLLVLVDVEFHPEDANIKAQNIIFKESYNFRQFWFWLQKNVVILFVLIAVVLSLISLWAWKILKKRKLNRDMAANRAIWLSRIQNAQTRKDLEQLFLLRHKWNKIFPGKYTEDLLNYINTIQYAPEWSNDELSTLLEKLDNMRKNIL